MSTNSSLRIFIHMLVAEAMGQSFTRMPKDPSVQRIPQMNRTEMTHDILPNNQNYLELSDDELLDQLEDEQDEHTLPHRT